MQTEPDECTEFGRRLRALRVERGLSQEELAHRAGLDRTYISSCEAGRRNVTLRTICRLAAALETRPATLIEDIVERIPQEPRDAEGSP